MHMHDKLNEATLSSDQLLDGKLLKVYRDEVRLPDGNSSHREWIDHPGASAVLPLFDDGTVLLVRQYRYAARDLFLELPAGKFDTPSESAEAVARRELEEETGLTAERWHYIGHSRPCIGYSNESIHYFIAEDLSSGEQDLQEAEFIETVRMPLEQAFAMAESSEIDDMKTVAGLLLARGFLRRNGRIVS
ncbi:MAG: NUDIX domain-containing protein [Rhodothermales bacterium]